ncbi:MAG TPA: hypothetical protein VJT78_14370 [Candidatus Dormibacteraeota bacterium]|nr:hypothetical protein [Candidatus Dormibacteraeota bacterium]
MPTAEDFAYARDAGLMFDPPNVDHDEAALQVRSLVRRVSLHQVVEAFVSSLSTGRLDLRSALTSYVIGRALPIHNFRPRQRAAICGVCGVASFITEPADWNRFSFERHRWGGVWIHDPYYIAFDLEQFAAGDHPVVTSVEWEVLRDLLTAIREISAADSQIRPGGLADALRSTLPHSNDSQRRHLVTTLAAIGVLEPRTRASFRSGWIDYEARPDPPEWKSNWFYPSGFWRGADGIDPAAVAEFFPHLLGNAVIGT